MCASSCSIRTFVDGWFRSPNRWYMMMVAADRSAVTVAVEETGAERAGSADANPRPMTPQNRLFGEVDTGRAFQDRMIMPIMWVACFVLHVSQCNPIPPPEVGVRTEMDR